VSDSRDRVLALAAPPLAVPSATARRTKARRISPERLPMICEPASASQLGTPIPRDIIRLFVCT